MSEFFWTDGTAQDPKRAFRFIVRVTPKADGAALPAYTAKKVTKPSFSLAESEHQYLNHTFYYPGRLTWNTVTLTLVDPINPDAAESLVKIINQGGYSPADDSTDLVTMSKAKAKAALGKFEIQQINAEGHPVETWELHNAWIKDAKFGDLAYDSDDLTEVELEIRYDFASFKKNQGGGEYWKV